ncbi:NAD(P)H-dependent oxidoreductase [Thorsellia kenyensis]|uniref:NAD(P)H-dependent oxidoreductase n=1 Tax=Thorsellia kenyensis TaxID=1549888 RepID=A0ABV6CD34_9GAMM
MSNIFIINAGKDFGHSKGELNRHISEFAKETLEALGHKVKMTHISEGYDIENEIDNYLWSDVIIYQQPAWWMGTPWSLKKYMDEVFTAGYEKLYANDGRTRKDPTKHYGTGGLLQTKKYMISATWNAPKNAFTDPQEFFEGKGLDAVYFPFHKANQFLGLTPLKSFSFHDVIKAPDLENELQAFAQHLENEIK